MFELAAWLAGGAVAYWLLVPAKPDEAPSEKVPPPYRAEVDGEVGPRILFLDFDGVLHLGVSGTFYRMPALLAFLEARPDWQVVVSSDWRLSHSLETLRGYFPASVRHRIVATTPYHAGQLRSSEIEAFVHRHGVTDYLALDDRPELFEPGFARLFVVDEATALLPAHVPELLALTSDGRRP